MKKPFTKLWLGIFILVCVNFSVYAQLKLPAIFTSGMVLQRGVQVNVWGSAVANDTVYVTILRFSGNTVADENGNWRILLPQMAATGPIEMTVSTSSESITYNNVYVGDVWLASGQSNMEMQLQYTDNATSEINSVNDAKLRQFKIPKSTATEPSDDLASGSKWSWANSTGAKDFTAVGYYFAKFIRETNDIPIGIINASYGGSRVEAWMSDEMLGFDEEVKLADGEPERQPTLLYNKMIHPILPFTIKGVIWYQAESNGDSMEDALGYGKLFKKLITGWRELWGLGDIPFYWVQLPGFGEIREEPWNWDAWPQLRAQQSSALELHNTGEAITIDVGAVDIHPTNKRPVGERLAMIAREKTYGENVISSSPRYVSNILREDGKIEITMNDFDGGLTAVDSDDNSLNSFALGNNDGTLVWANAALENNKVIVWSDEITDPTIIRYAWEYQPPVVNFYNSGGLPVAPFYADVFPGFKIKYFKSTRSAIESGQSTVLSWKVFGASEITIDGTVVDSVGTLSISPAATTTYTLLAVSREDATKIDTAYATVEVLDPNQINRTLNKPVKATTVESSSGSLSYAEYAVDDDFETRWSSAWQTGDDGTEPDPNVDDDPDDEAIMIDMGEAIDIERVILFWEDAYGSSYDIDISYDGYNWTTVYEERNSDGGEDNITFDTPVSGRFLRMHGIERATTYGYSLWEIKAYGTLSTKVAPTVSVLTSVGNIVETGDEITIIANANDEDGEIVSASFYVDGEFLETITTAPFETSWKVGDKDTSGVYVVVEDNDGIKFQSEPLTIYKEKDSFVRFEAEQGDFTGGVTVKVLSSVSNRKYLDMQDGWTLTINDIEIPEDGKYLFTVGYQLTYDSPKAQNLYINDEYAQELYFQAPDKTSWLQNGWLVDFKKGTNTVMIQGVWNWMSIDYIAVDGAVVVGVEDEVQLPLEFSLNQNYPNPFNPTTVISYRLSAASKVQLKIYDLLGREVATLVNKEQPAGNYSVNFDAGRLSSGAYIYRIQAGDFVASKKLMLMK